MKIKLENFHGNILSLMRSFGYAFLERSPDDEWNFVRRMDAGDYPRFHCYVSAEGGSQPEADGPRAHACGGKKENGYLLINLHLDQKRPSYQGSRGHSGEYKGEIITLEAERLRQSFAKTR